MKQFSKFKQFADKAFVRTDRTDVMSEDLLYAERHIELMKQTCETTVKKLGACIHVSGPKDGASDRRIKKVPEWILGSSLNELGKKYEEGSVLSKILSDAGEIEMTIGTQMTAHEGKVEPIIADLQKLVDNDFPAVYKLRRNLAKLTENMDTAKNKLQQANRHSLSAATGGRIENFKDELDESQVKVEQCRDNLASEMYQLLSKQTGIAQSIVQFLKYQQEYHQCIANTLSLLLPEVETALTKSTSKPVYGTDLAEHLVASERTIAYPLEFCVCSLLETGLMEEGLFRVAGSASKVKKLKSAFNAWILDSDLKGLMGEFNDPHVIGNALKCYLRELPNPLLTTELYSEWIDAIRISDNPEKLQALWNVVQRLPTGNRDNLRYLIKFLRKLSDHQDVNKMSSANIAIVLGPNLLWNPAVSDEISQDSTPMGLNMAMTHWFSSIVEQLVTYADWFFPGEIEFYITCEKPEPEWISVNLRNMSVGTLLSAQGSSLSNGGSTEDILEDNQLSLKRSQSTSSLDEQSAPNESPKPVVRRKVKPAPLPPGVAKTEPQKLISLVDPPKPAQQPQRPPPFEQPKTLAVGKREGMWIPPSPSQMTNRSSYMPQQNVAVAAPQSTTSAVTTSQSATTAVAVPQVPKAVPPKPPQPAFLKDRSPSTDTTVNSTLRHKSSFRASSKMESKEVDLSPGPPSYISASLPRRFHTENSYKNASPRPVMDLFKVDGSSTVANQNPVKTEPVEKVVKNELAEKDTKTLPEKDSSSVALNRQKSQDKPMVGNEKINSTNSTTTTGKDSKVNESGSLPLNSSSAESKTSPTGSPTQPKPASTSPVSDTPRPVPAPRSSLHKEGVVEISVKGIVSKERPSVKAKPRDLVGGKRSTHGDQMISTHCRNSSGSGQDSEGDIFPDGKTYTPNSSLPTSRAQSRADSTAEEVKGVEVIQSKEARGSIPSEDEAGVDGNVPISSSKSSFRPPRPTPPAPPKGKGSRDSTITSTDF